MSDQRDVVWDAARESRYREHRLPRDESLVQVLVIFAVSGMLAMLVNDLRLDAGRTTQLAGIRAGFVAVALGGWWLWRLQSSPLVRDGLLVAAALVLDHLVLLVSLMRPPGHIGFALPIGMVVVVHFVLLPMPLLAQLLLASLYLGEHALLLIDPARVPDASVRDTGLVMSGAAFLVGSLSSIQLERATRTSFLLLEEQRTLKEQLAASLAQIRTLRGLVPICSFCKSIRDDAGEWHSLEAYVEGRTHASFTHGICPTCMAAKYPDA